MGASEQPPYPPEQPEPASGPGSADLGPGWESSGLGNRVNEIVDAVEREAAKLRQEAEADAAEIRYRAEEEARRYVEHARSQAESLTARRMERIQELSDVLMARAEEVLERLDYAVPVKTGFENLVRALGETAERLANQDYSEFAEPSWEEVGGPESQPAAQASRAPSPSPQAAAPEQAAYGSTPSAGPGEPPQAAGPPPAFAQPPEPPPSFSQTPIGRPAGSGPAAGPGWQDLDDAHRIAIQMAASGSTRAEIEAHLAHAPEPARSSVLDEIFGAGSPPETRVPWATPPQG